MKVFEVRVAKKHSSSSPGGRTPGKVVPLKEGPDVLRSTLDDTDRAILRALQANARATYTEVGKAVGLSAPSVHDRVQRLEQRGVIRGYRAELDPDALGLTVLALVSVLPSDNANATEMARAFAGIEHVESAYTVAGEESHVLVVRTGSMAELSEVLQRLRDVDGVARTRTAVVLSTPLHRGPTL
ncbi:MAG TPA: Lrp/AsnC family transcriptional regulator [Actinomycetes bacterium]